MISAFAWNFFHPRKKLQALSSYERAYLALPELGMFSLIWKGGWQSEGREAGQFQERDHACDLPFHHIQHHQTKELIAVGLGLLPIETEGRAAIGACWKQVPVPARNAKPCREFCG